jgi:hypothetical protein
MPTRACRLVAAPALGGDRAITALDPAPRQLGDSSDQGSDRFCRTLLRVLATGTASLLAPCWRQRPTVPRRAAFVKRASEAVATVAVGGSPVCDPGSCSGRLAVISSRSPLSARRDRTPQAMASTCEMPKQWQTSALPESSVEAEMTPVNPQNGPSPKVRRGLWLNRPPRGDCRGEDRGRRAGHRRGG